MNLKTIKKYLKKGSSKTGGRNNKGKISTFHKGGGHKQSYRKINFKQNINIEGKIVSIEYDPNRSANIALIYDNKNNKYFYILAPENLKVYQPKVDKKSTRGLKNLGNRFLLKDLPIGTEIYNIELYPNKGGQLVRAAGTFAKILQKQEKFVKIKLPSKEERFILNKCSANIGIVSNKNNKNINLKKAGQSRWLNKKPVVRGVAMNPVDHPHGGGEGKTSGGRLSVTPWGKLTKGKKTVLKKNKLILKKKFKK